MYDLGLLLNRDGTLEKKIKVKKSATIGETIKYT